MKRFDISPTVGPLLAMACECSVWPIATLYGVRRCGECGVTPRRIPVYRELPE